MTLVITVLGSGTAIPDADRFPAGYLLRSGPTMLLVDCGPGTLRRFAAAGGDLRELDAVFLTHYHTDHCADLAPLLFALRNPMYAHRRPLHLYGAPGLQRLLDKQREAWPWAAAKDYELHVHELQPCDLQCGSLSVRAVPIRHTAQSLGYRFCDPDGNTAAFSGDADECQELVELARDVDLFVCDAAFPDEAYVEGHLTPGMAGRHAAEANAATLVLTHFYPKCSYPSADPPIPTTTGNSGPGSSCVPTSPGPDTQKYLAQAKAHFDGHVVLAEDLMRFVVDGRRARIDAPAT
jgi:ribonuclease BN (tRNA processing enzyme)